MIARERKAPASEQKEKGCARRGWGIGGGGGGGGKGTFNFVFLLAVL